MNVIPLCLFKTSNSWPILDNDFRIELNSSLYTNQNHASYLFVTSTQISLSLSEILDKYFFVHFFKSGSERFVYIQGDYTGDVLAAKYCGWRDQPMSAHKSNLWSLCLDRYATFITEHCPRRSKRYMSTDSMPLAESVLESRFSESEKKRCETRTSPELQWRWRARTTLHKRNDSLLWAWVHLHWTTGESSSENVAGIARLLDETIWLSLLHKHCLCWKSVFSTLLQPGNGIFMHSISTHQMRKVFFNDLHDRDLGSPQDVSAKLSAANGKKGMFRGDLHCDDHWWRNLRADTA